MIKDLQRRNEITIAVAHINSYIPVIRLTQYEVEVHFQLKIWIVKRKI